MSSWIFYAKFLLGLVSFGIFYVIIIIIIITIIIVIIRVVQRTNIIFEADETDATLLVDASNAFNSLNRAAALNNIRVLCPLIATYVTNTYRVPARLFVVGGSELKSAEGTTQGDPLAMSMYAISLQPLISLLHNRSTAKQCWFADAATGGGPLEKKKKLVAVYNVNCSFLLAMEFGK